MKLFLIIFVASLILVFDAATALVVMHYVPVTNDVIAALITLWGFSLLLIIFTTAVAMDG